MASATYRGRMIVNDTDYTGSFVDPNPSGTATDDLNTVSIDGKIFNVVGSGGGGSIRDVTNYYGVFIDTANIIQATTTFAGNIDTIYTATEDCVAIVVTISNADNSAQIYVDDVKVWDQYDSSGIEQHSNAIYLKRGQTIKMYQSYTLATGSYTIYGLQSGDRIPALIQDAQIYSLEEKQIGVWTDGKPLYQKTIQVTLSTIGSNIYGYYAEIDTRLYLNNPENVFFIRGQFQADGTQRDWIEGAFEPPYMYVYTGASRSNVPSTITFQYTKTTDEEGNGGYQAYGMSPIIYSTKEREVGIWTDNKPLYAKTYNLNSSVRITNSGTNISQYIDNRNDIETLVRGESFCTVGTSSQSVQSTALWVGYTSKDNIMAYCAEGATSNCITLYYTKTVDTPKRTGYELLDIQENQIIVDATRYSTEEKIVGTWVDNKPLYQKTFLFNQQVITDNAWTTNILGTVGSGIEIVDYDGTFGLTGNPHFADFSYYRGSSEYFTAYIPSNNGHNDDINVRPNMNAGVNVTLDKVTIWYTKDSDAAGSGGYQAYGFSPIIYSTEEREVGVWKNNKPLYQKTCVFGSVSGQTANLSLGIANIEEAFLCADASYVNDGTCPLPYVTGTAYANNIGGFFDIGVNDTSFAIRIGQSMAGSVNNVVLTVRYTKTTDVAGSGEYNTLGVPNVHYDGNEKIIGTWFGETLYQKTLVIHNESTVSSNTTITTIDSTFRVKNWKAFAIEKGVNYQIPYVTGNSNASFYFRENGNVEFTIINTSFAAGSDFYITIEYTKTTD